MLCHPYEAFIVDHEYKDMETDLMQFYEYRINARRELLLKNNIEVLNLLMNKIWRKPGIILLKKVVKMCKWPCWYSEVITWYGLIIAWSIDEDDQELFMSLKYELRLFRCDFYDSNHRNFQWLKKTINVSKCGHKG